MEIKLELNMKCQACNAINFAVPYAEKEKRKCFRCGGELKELTVDLKEDGELAAEEAKAKAPKEGEEAPPAQQPDKADARGGKNVDESGEQTEKKGNE